MGKHKSSADFVSQVFGIFTYTDIQKLPAEDTEKEFNKTKSVISMLSSSETTMNFVIDVITTVRILRSENKITPDKIIDIMLINVESNPMLDCYVRNYIKQLAKIDHIIFTNDINDLASRVSDSGITIGIKVNNTKINDKEITKLKIELEKIRSKLNNVEFIKNAPLEVIEGVREKENIILKKLKS